MPIQYIRKYIRALINIYMYSYIFASITKLIPLRDTSYRNYV